MLFLNDLTHIVGIEFYDIIEDDINVEIVRQGKHLSIVEVLASKFKSELLIIGKKYSFNDNDDDFIPLRKYYATALKHTLLNDVPESDPKFLKLKNEIGYGLEYVYYENIVIPKLVNKVYKKFFIDIHHPLLYSFIENESDYSFKKKYNSYSYLKEIKTAINPVHEDIADKISNNIQSDEFGIKIKDMFSTIFSKKWTDEYEERLIKIFSATSQKIIKSHETDVSTIKYLVDNI